MRVVFRRLAWLEYSEAVAWYESEEPGLGDAFQTDVRKLTMLMQDFPHAGFLLTADMRRLVLRRFPFQIVYRVEGGVIRVYSVFHCSRDPARLQFRLSDEE
jgi:toxin ParE1/3/4